MLDACVDRLHIDVARRTDAGMAKDALCVLERSMMLHVGTQRPPHHLETSVPGVFVAGDVRAESAKRVAAAVGEGSMAVMLVHRYLAED